MSCVDFSTDGKYLVSGSASGSDPRAQLWHLNNSHGGAPALIRSILTGHEAGLMAVKISPDVQKLVCASLDATLTVWDAHSGEKLLTFRGHESEDKRQEDLDTLGGSCGQHGVYCAAWSPDSACVASGAADNAVLLWDAVSGALVTQPLRLHSASVYCVAFGARRRLLVSGSQDTTVVVWDLGEGRDATAIRVLKGHTAAVNSVSLAANDKMIASRSYDKTVRLWDVCTGEQRRILMCGSDLGKGVAISRDGRFVVSGASFALRCWSIDVTVCAV